ncbi:hypothetical protein JHD50_12445 [Sulfurimonas sp. MAG313]|nr:hypothetical protein [Sulfurimonas sp. MAG313]MDF1882098.1 hypothetical protein [Sulfurimonas sp. MAG313]
MITQIQGKLFNVFKTKDFTNKESLEVRAGKWQLQFLTEKDMGDGLGDQMILDKISIPPSMIHDYKDKVGEEVTVKVGVMTDGKKIIYYGIE